MKQLAWHVSYVNRNNTIMELAETREDAIALAQSLMNKGFRIHSVGSMKPDSYESLSENKLRATLARAKALSRMVATGV